MLQEFAYFQLNHNKLYVLPNPYFVLFFFNHTPVFHLAIVLLFLHQTPVFHLAIVRPSSSSSDFRPSENRQNHLKTSARETAFSPLVLCSFLYVSLGNSPNSMQNFMLARISRRSCDVYVLWFKRCSFSLSNVN
jgi:hypothetical protein